MSIDNGDHARSLMQRILRLHEEVDTIKGDIREVYAEARSMGYDKAAMGEAIRIIRKREKDSAAFEERTAIVELYLSTFDQTSHVPARERMREGNETRPDATPAGAVVAETSGVTAGETAADGRYVEATVEQRPSASFPIAKPYDPGPIPAFLDRRVKREQVEA